MRSYIKGVLEELRHACLHVSFIRCSKMKIVRVRVDWSPQERITLREGHAQGPRHHHFNLIWRIIIYEWSRLSLGCTIVLRLVCLTVIASRCIYTFIHSFILETYIAPLQETNTQRRSQPRTKKKDFWEIYNLEGWAISKERSPKGRSFHADGPTIEKALRCIIAKRARGTKNSPLAAERSTRRAAKTDTGQQRTRR